jgi:hypothetical protein
LTESMSLLVGFRWLLAIAGGIYVASWALGSLKGARARGSMAPLVHS